MSQSATSSHGMEDTEALAGALFSWCAERSIGLRTQEGVRVAGDLIDLFFAGYRTQEELRIVLSHCRAGEMTFPA